MSQGMRMYICFHAANMAEEHDNSIFDKLSYVELMRDYIKRWEMN